MANEIIKLFEYITQSPLFLIGGIITAIMFVAAFVFIGVVIIKIFRGFSDDEFLNPKRKK